MVSNILVQIPIGKCNPLILENKRLCLFIFLIFFTS